MTPDDQNAPATKADIQFLTEQFGLLLDRADRTDGHIDDLRSEMKAWKEEIVHEFKVIAEDLRHDLIGSHKDKIEQHEDRLVRLERHTGLRPA